MNVTMNVLSIMDVKFKPSYHQRNNGLFAHLLYSWCKGEDMWYSSLWIFLYSSLFRMFICISPITLHANLALADDFEIMLMQSPLVMKIIIVMLAVGLLVTLYLYWHLYRKLRVEISKRDKVAAELRKQSENNRALLLAAGDGIHVLNLQGDLVLANEAFCRHLGYSIDDILRLNVADWDVRWTKEELIANIPDLRGQVSTFETQHKRRDGAVVPVEINSIGVEIDGEPLLFCSARDVSLRKIQEVQLSQAASVFHHSHDGIVLLDQHWNVLDVNESFIRLTGYELSEIINRPIPIMNDDRQSKILLKIEQSLSDTGIWTGEIENTGKNNERYFIKLTLIKAVASFDGNASFIGVLTDITQIKRYQAELERMIHYDALTNLPNRVLLMDRIAQAIHTSDRSGLLVFVLYIDLDGFKNINDQYGHGAGDYVLTSISQAMSNVLRSNDTLARIGGDEFIGILTEIPSRDVGEHLVRRLLLAASTTCEWNNTELTVSASIGISLYPTDCTVAADLVHKADMAMYTAKQRGKNQYAYL